MFTIETEATERLVHVCSYQSLHLWLSHILLLSANPQQLVKQLPPPHFSVMFTTCALLHFVHWKKGMRHWHRKSLSDGFGVFSLVDSIALTGDLVGFLSVKKGVETVITIA
ncbi:hypothetical protein ATANTOWER_006445 [Ataeniobius toweri]|uniref:Uncharacterized protein n=1 Tax=Ataeniobius toweri TaxID=208326 RepID=A0ABU7B553_9TELE|nr:hypothetical protein [Ataeniobius toweri]